MVSRRELLETGLASVATGAAASWIAGGLARPGLAQSTQAAPVPSIVPRSNAPAKHLMVAWADRLEPDEATACAVMQGLVNRDQPQVFLVWDVEDSFWLNWLRERGDVETVEWVSRYEVFRRFRERIKGCVVTDPAVPATVNVATLLSGINDWLVVSPELIDVFGLPIKEDLRGRWKRSVETYRWAYEQLLPSASKSALSHMNPWSSRLRDYMTQFKVFTFWLSGAEDQNGQEEVDLARELFQRVGPNTPILGWWGSHGRGEPKGIGEMPGVTLASEYGLMTDCMDWDGHCEGTSNLSVHSGTRATFRQRPAPPVPKLENKVYYSFVRTDGDGTNFWRQEYLRRWQDAAHGEFPINWPVGPMASDFVPDIVDYFYRRASDNDFFMVAVSGIGYIHEDVYGAKLSPELREKSFDRFLRLTGEYMRRMDLHHLQSYKTSSPELVERYTHIEGLEGLFLNYNREEGTSAGNAAQTVNGVPVFRTVTGRVPGETWDEKVQSAVAQIRELTPARRPAFLNCSLTNWGGTEMETLGVIEKVRRALSPDYVAVRADHLVALYRQHAS